MIHRWFSRFTAQPLPATEWRAAQARVALLTNLNEADAERLGQRAWHFLNHKRITLHADLRDTPFDLAAQLVLAGQACLLTLGWSDAEHQEAFANVHEILILPDGFSREMEEVDETGVVHLYSDTLAGETSYQGPVILSFTDLMKSGGFTGSNVLIHELAHKLDMGNSIDTDARHCQGRSAQASGTRCLATCGTTSMHVLRGEKLRPLMITRPATQVSVTPSAVSCFLVTPLL